MLKLPDTTAGIAAHKLARQVAASIRRDCGAGAIQTINGFREGFNALSGNDQLRYAYTWYLMFCTATGQHEVF